MARAHRDVAEGQRLQDPPDVAFIYYHEESCQDPVTQIAQPPAHDAIFRKVWALLNPLCQHGLLFNRQFWGRATSLWKVREASYAMLVVTNDPVTQRLPIHAAAVGRVCPALTFQNQG
jgi:hypothetical protein